MSYLIKGGRLNCEKFDNFGEVLDSFGDDREVNSRVSRSSFLLKPIVQTSKYCVWQPNNQKYVAAVSLGWRSRTVIIALDELSEEINGQIPEFVHHIAGDRVDSVLIECSANPLGSDLVAPSFHLVREMRATNYVIDLTKEIIFDNLSSNHKRNIKKAREHLKVVDLPRNRAIAEHVELIAHSNLRQRSQGQRVVTEDHRKNTTRYLNFPGAKLYQAMFEGKIASSMLVVSRNRCAYYIMGGTSAEGMSVGASQYLYFYVMTTLKANGIYFLSLGIANSEGLARYKIGFGAHGIPLLRYTLSGPGSSIVSNVIDWGALKFRCH